MKEGETTNDIFAFLTTEPNNEVGAIHPKAMPVILTTREEIDTWMNAPAGEALKLQRPLARRCADDRRAGGEKRRGRPRGLMFTAGATMLPPETKRHLSE